MTTIRWTKLDQPGEEIAQLQQLGDGKWHLSGKVTLGSDTIGYSIQCDAGWRTEIVQVNDLMIIVGPPGTWRMNGAEVPAVQGCVDIDLSFTPSTNLLPIRRTYLATGQAVDVRAAWLRYPQMTLEPLDQTYTRIDDTHVHYSSAGGAFERTLTIDDAGFPVDYPGLWRAV